MRLVVGLFVYLAVGRWVRRRVVVGGGRRVVRGAGRGAFLDPVLALPYTV